MANAVAIIERFLGSKAGQQMVVELESEVLQRRQQLVKERAELLKRQERDLPPLREAIEPAKERVFEAQRALREAEAAHGQAATAYSNATFRFDSQIERINVELRKGASAAIDEALQELAARHEGARRPNPVEVAYYDSAKGRVAVHNRDSVLRHLAALQAARPMLEDLRLEALSPEQLHERIAAIYGGIPPIERPELPARERSI